MRQLLLLFFSLLLPFIIAAQDLTCDDEFILTGTAVQQGECIQLTADANTQQGCMWYDGDIDFSMPFTHNMTMSFGNNNNGADGICLVYQNNSTSECGISGEGIGAQGIDNSFIVEFDTYQNGNLGDPFNDHAAINVNGDFNTTVYGPVDLGNIEDGNDHDVTFTWDPGTNSFQVFFDGVLILSGIYDIINNCFGGSPLGFWGYTSSTGGESNEHIVCPGLPPEVVADAGNTIEIPCLGALVTLDGSGSDTGSEFEYTWTTGDGNIVSGENTDSPTVDEPGTYTLTVYNNITLCESMDEVEVTINELVAEIDEPLVLDCNTEQITLSGAGSSSGDDISYQWSTDDGDIIETNGTEATVGAPGEYTLTVIYDDGQGGFCSEETTVLVEEQTDAPDAVALDEILTCEPPNVELDGTGSSEGNNFSYQWTTDEGNILSGANTLFPVVDAEGFYTLTVINDLTGCTNDITVFVEANIDLPDAIAFADDELGCGTPSLIIDGSLSSFGDEFTYEWTTSDGNIVDGADEMSPEVDQPGFYTLVVTNTETNCTDQTTVEVMGGNNPVTAAISMPEALTCIIEAVLLDGSPSVPMTGVTYTWTTTDGQFGGPSDEVSATATEPGQYTLTVFDPDSGCSDTETITVTQNITPPVAEAGTAQPFGCDDVSQQLNGSGSTNPDATYSWTTMNGTIVSGANTLTPTVSSAGTYTLVVMSTINGCTAEDQVVVVGDDDTPVVQIMLSDTLDCVTDLLTLNAAGSTTGPDYDQVWSTSDGNFVSGTDGLQPVVDQAGTYTLTITNTTNGCDNSAAVTVVQDTLSPVAAITTPIELNCTTTSQVLDGSGSSQGAEFIYTWSTPDGTITSPTDTVIATITAPGTYTLEVFNSANNCTRTATVTVTENTAPPEVMIPPVDPLNCVEMSRTIAATLTTSFPDPNYLWTTADGTIGGSDNTAQITALAPGTYTVNVTNPANGCTDSADFTLTENVTPPLAAAGPDAELTCVLTSQTLGGGSATGNNISYTWTSPDVPLTAADSLITLAAMTEGTYILEVLNTDNFCVDRDTVVVAQDIVPPSAAIAPPNQLTCTASQSLLDGTGSSGAANLTFAWSTINGSLVGDPGADQIFAGQEGTYQLIVTNPVNGCTDTMQTMVTQDENFPQAGIDIPQPLTCDRLVVMLNGTANSSSGAVSFTWTTVDGNITAGANTLQPTVDSEGTYTLTVEDTNNNCTAQAEMQVVLDDTPPLVEAGPDTLLNCAITEITLVATADAQGAGVTYAWATMDGNFTTGTNTATPDIDASGMYQVEVTNAVNGCSATDELQVALDTISPMVTIAVPDILTCADTLVALDASGSSAGGAPVYAWTSTAGQPIDAANTSIASVTQAGTYEVLVTNTNNGCTQTSEVVVMDNLTPPVPNIQVLDTLDCATFNVGLDATASTGANLSYSWSSPDGYVIDNPTSALPTVMRAGVYELVITDGENGCTAASSIEVEDFSETPLFMIQTPITIDCNNPVISLGAATASNIGENPSYLWTTPDGNLVDNETTLMPSVDQAGTYFLTVTNNDNGCVGIDSILVRDDLEAPIIVFDPVDVLNCTIENLDISAVASSGNGTLTYSWTTPAGNITGTTDEDAINVDAPGAYGLLLLNTDNGCTDSLGVTVLQDTITPVVTIADPAMLDCDLASFALDATGSSSGPDLQITWTTVGGQIDGGEDGLMPTISQPGSYTLEIINTVNTCTNSAMVTVMQDDEVPVIVFATPEALNCVVLMTDLDADGSSTGDNLIYTWTTSDGNYTSGTDGLMPTVDAPGTYTLTVENPDNNCENSANIVVVEDITPPIAQAGTDFVLDCAEEQEELDGSGSSQGGDFTYAWTATSGAVILDANTLTPTITTPDTYELLVTNNNNGCTATDVVVITENIPVATLEAIQPLCFGDAGTIIFTSTQGGTPPYLYTIDVTAGLQPQPLFPDVVPGGYTATIEDANGCTYTEVIEIDEPDSLSVVITNPEAELSIDYGDSLRLTAQTNYPETALTTIIWRDSTTLSCGDCLAPYALPTETTLYQLTLITENGCTDDAFVRIFVNREFPVYFPNVFSPNGDGDNDIFYPFAELGAVNTIHEFQVFDRWGNVMHSAAGFAPNDPLHGWNGERAGVPLNPAVFVYFAEVEFADGTRRIFKGDVTLVR